jgi:hypothetical protein
MSSTVPRAPYPFRHRGKTTLACFLLAAQMRHAAQSIFVFDPQGQFTTQNDLPMAAAAFYAGLAVYLVVPFREVTRVLIRRHGPRQRFTLKERARKEEQGQ